MRMSAVILLALFIAIPAFADDAIAGRTHILLAGPGAGLWVPIAGGEARPLVSPYGESSSAAFDGGERYLVAHEGARISLFEEGETHPTVTRELDPSASSDRVFAAWDGERFLVAWSRESGDVQLAIHPESDLVQTVSLSGVRNVNGLVAHGGQILLFEEQLELPGEGTGTAMRHLRGILLNADLTVKKITTLGEIAEPSAGQAPATFQRVLSAIPFGDGFYVAWYQGEYLWGGERSPLSRIVGTRITAEGDALDVRARQDGEAVEGQLLLTDGPETFDTDLIDLGDSALAVMKRAKFLEKGKLTGTFIAPDGRTLGTRFLAIVDLRDSDLWTKVETVRLQDGRVVAVSLADSEVSIIPIDPTLPKQRGRRRAVR